MVTHTCHAHEAGSPHRASEGISGRQLLALLGEGAQDLWLHLLQRHNWESSQRAAAKGSNWDGVSETCRLGLELRGPEIGCIWGFGSELLSSANLGSCAGIALTKHLPRRHNPTGNLQDLGAKSYWVFCRVRSLNSLPSFGGHRRRLLTANKTCSKPHCCQIPNGPALLGLTPNKGGTHNLLTSGFAGLFAQREGLLPRSVKKTLLQLELFQSKQIDVTWFSWNLLESFTTMWWFILSCSFLHRSYRHLKILKQLLYR